MIVGVVYLCSTDHIIVYLYIYKHVFADCMLVEIMYRSVFIVIDLWVVLFLVN